MKIIDVQPGTDEWKNFRNDFFTASEASIMMGENKQTSRNDLLYQKYTGVEQTFSDWIENVLFSRGHEIENKMRPVAEEIIGQSLYPSVGISDDERFLASYDGITIDHSIVWECKQWNAEKAKIVKQGLIPKEDLWQVVQQLFISEAKKCLYMVTDGDTKTEYCWHNYDSVEHYHLIMYWNQFEDDLKKYKPKIITQAFGIAPDTLPALRIEVTGMVEFSNLKEFEEKAISTLSQINTDLQNDTDFANAEKTIKWCKEIEIKLDLAKEQALNQTATIDELFKTIDSIKEQARNKRLTLDRLVIQRKKTIRNEIAENAENDIYQYIERVNKKLKRVYLPFVMPDFSSVMKGKKMIKSLHDAVDDLIAKTKIEINELVNLIELNLQSYQEIGINHDFLFHDLQQIITKPNDDFVAVIKTRIMEYKQKGKEQVEQLKKTLSKPEIIERIIKPSDDEIIDVLCSHYNVTKNMIVQWLLEMKLTNGSISNVKG